ncbi:MAG: acyl-CoA desaturase [Burkholderiaceae bacterium]|nr:acyl-CoA desaturase [Burkholderiaceae bacterium]
MKDMPKNLVSHRASVRNIDDVVAGQVHYAPMKSIWFLSMLVAALVGGAFTVTWQAILLYVLTTLAVLLFGHSLGSHRKLIHNSFECPKMIEYLFVYLGVQVGLAGPLGLLRQHELRDYAQRLPDCHAYLRHGSSFWKDAWWQLNCELRLDAPPVINLEPRIAKDNFYIFLEKTWMLQHLLVAVIFYTLGGWSFVFWGVCARVTSGVFGHWLIGYFAHNHGDMAFKVNGAAVQGKNIPWTSFLTMGESWHNNHHAYPGSAKLGIGKGEWDPGWWVLCAMEKFGLAWNIKLPADLPERSELVSCVPSKKALVLCICPFSRAIRGHR